MDSWNLLDPGSRLAHVKCLNQNAVTTIEGAISRVSHANGKRCWHKFLLSITAGTRFFSVSTLLSRKLCCKEGEAARQLPINAQFIQMEQQCAWGMLGQLLVAKLIDLNAFGSFIVVTSFVRGPFVPAAFQVSSAQ